MERESMEFDVVVVGAGPAGLSAAIKLSQLAQEQEREVSICVVEKGSEVGAHILSGAVLETTALDELLPDWRSMGSPLNTEVTKDVFSTTLPGNRLRKFQICSYRRRFTTMAITSFPWVTSAVGLLSRPKIWALRSTQALPLPNCCSMMMAQ